jgi:endonuclease YncB( thermonuclease family)
LIHPFCITQKSFNTAVTLIAHGHGLMPLFPPASLRSLASAALLMVVLLAPVSAQAAPATVISIGDGDTLRVRNGGRIQTVRLACIDAPETSQAPHGASPRQQLQALAPVGTLVRVANPWGPWLRVSAVT